MINVTSHLRVAHTVCRATIALPSWMYSDSFTCVSSPFCSGWSGRILHRKGIILYAVSRTSYLDLSKRIQNTLIFRCRSCWTSLLVCGFVPPFFLPPFLSLLMFVNFVGDCQFCRWLSINVWYRSRPSLTPDWFLYMVLILSNVNIALSYTRSIIFARPRFALKNPADLRSAIYVFLVKFNYPLCDRLIANLRGVFQHLFQPDDHYTHTYVKWIRYATQASAGKLMNNRNALNLNCAFWRNVPYNEERANVHTTCNTPKWYFCIYYSITYVYCVQHPRIC